MVTLYKDGITVQAISSQEVAEYKKLGFVEVETPTEAESALDKKSQKKAGE